MPHLAPAPIDLYVSSTLLRLDRAVADLTLSEPTIHEPASAARVLECLLETLAGLAIGSAVGAVIAGVRRTFGVEITTRTDLRPPARDVRYLDEPGPLRSVTGALKLRLRQRIALGARDVAVLTAGIEAQIAAADRRAFARMLSVLAGDELVAERYAHQVRAGWRCAHAAIDGRTVPAVTAMWQHWARRFAGERRVVVPQLAPEVIVRIA